MLKDIQEGMKGARMVGISEYERCIYSFPLISLKDMSIFKAKQHSINGFITHIDGTQNTKDRGLNRVTLIAKFLYFSDIIRN